MISLINGHMDEPELYVLYDADGVNEGPVYGVFSSYDKALKAIEWEAVKMVDEMLRDNDPEDSGIDESDRGYLLKECKASFAIQCLYGGIDRIGCKSKIKHPYA